MSSSNESERTKPIDLVRKVASERRSTVIDGMRVDEVTAQMVIKVYDRSSTKRREKLDKLSVKRLVARAFDLSESA